MPRRRHYDLVFDSDGSPTSSLYASPPSTRRSASPLPPPRRPSPHTFISEPPRLHVRERLSADAATRLMLEKWDLMDSLAAREADDPRGRRERRKSRASSMPSGPRRRVSRVREYEMWQPERERIRLAQVEMERRADEEKEEAQFVEAELVVKEAVAVKKVRDRKATPALVISRPVSDNEDEDDWRSTGRRSATTSMASTGSPPPRLDDLDNDERATDRRSKRRDRREADLRRSRSAAEAQPSRKEADRPSRSSRSHRKPPPPPEPSTRSSRRRPPPSRAVSLSAAPLQTPDPRDGHGDASRDRHSLHPPSRSSRRRPRPVSPSPSPSPSASPSPVRTPRSPGKSPSPPTDDDRPAATDLLGAAADAVEQAGEAVSSALSRVGALFSAGRTSGN